MLRGIEAYARRHHVALLALFFALGGTAVAAGNALLPRNSVGSAQVVNGSLAKADLSRKAVKALKGNKGPRGLRGATGATGAQGVAGTPGTKGDKGDPGATTLTVVQGPDVVILTGAKAFAGASCPAGSVATGGGGVNVNTSGVYLLQSFPNVGPSPTDWTVSYQNTSAGTVTVHARVVCASP